MAQRAGVRNGGASHLDAQAVGERTAVQRHHPAVEVKGATYGGQCCHVAGSSEVRDYANARGLSDEQALQSGMQSMSEEFKKAGGEMYMPIGKA